MFTGNDSMGCHTDVYSSIYGNAKVSGYFVIRGNVYGNARIKRHSDLYSVPINCEVYESDNIIKIDKQNK